MKSSFARPLVVSLVVVLIAVTLGGLTASAQSSTATVSGSVTDQTGATLADVNITVVNSATNHRQSVRTNRQGFFAISLLPPGSYTITAARDGFRTAVFRTILNTADELRIPITLQIGHRAETVEVTANSRTLDTTPGTSTTITSKFVRDMPLNGRSFQNLLLMTPGVVLSHDDGGLSVNGLRTDANYFTIDGLSANAGTTSSTADSGWRALSGATPALNAFNSTQSMLSVDALEEFKVQSSTYSAQYGRQPGAQVQLTSRSGSNQLHGSVFDYFRNDALDARITMPGLPNPRKQAMRQNDFGGTLGGAIQKNRTFYFFNYEGMRNSQPVMDGTVQFVPALSLRNNPSINANLRALMNLFPLPTGPEVTLINNVTKLPEPSGYATWNGQRLPSRFEMDQWSLRLDRSFGPKLFTFFRFNNSASETSNVTLVTVAATNFYARSYSFGADSAFSGNASNSFRLGHTRNSGKDIRDLQLIPGAGGVMPPDEAFAPDVRDSVMRWSFPNVNVGYGKNIMALQRQWNANDVLSWARAKHLVRFGVDYRYTFPKYQPLNYSLSANFSNLMLLQQNQASSLVITQQDNMTIVYRNLSLFAQDSWHVAPGLTLDYGVRWELNPPPRGRNPGDLRYVVNWQDPANMQIAPLGTLAYETDHHSFAPRLGAAYSLRDKAASETVLRAGWGMYYDLGSVMAALSATSWPHRRSASYSSVHYPFDSSVLVDPRLVSMAPPYTSQTFTAALTDFTLPVTQEWNVSLQQALGSSQSVTLTYQGNAARHMMRRYIRKENGNATFVWRDPTAYPPRPVTGPILHKDFVNSDFRSSTIHIARNDEGWGDNSAYQALVIEYTRSLSRGLEVLTNYTWSHATDTNSSDIDIVNSTTGAAGGDPGAGGGRSQISPSNSRGNSDNDRRHTFNLAAIYRLPAPRSLGWLPGPLSRAAEYTLSGWELATNFKAHTGTPLTVTFIRDMVPYEADSTYFRPDYIAGKPIWLNDPSVPGGKRFNLDAFAVPGSCMTANPAECRSGNVARNGHRGMGAWTADMSLSRVFRLPAENSSKTIQFKADFFNVFNHPTWGNPNTTLGTVTTDPRNGKTLFMPASTAVSSQPGIVTDLDVNTMGPGGLPAGYQFGGPRSIQFALKITF